MKIIKYNCNSYFFHPGLYPIKVKEINYRNRMIWLTNRIFKNKQNKEKMFKNKWSIRLQILMYYLN